MILVCVLSDDPSSHLIPTYGEDLLASYSEPDQVGLVNVQIFIIILIILFLVITITLIITKLSSE